MQLTDAKLRTLKATGRRFELTDRDGLVLRVSPSGIMSWAVSLRVRGASNQPGERVAKLAGKKQRITIGEYPAVSLALARERTAVMRRLAREGKDPRGSNNARPAAKTVQELIDKYVADLSSRGVRTAGNIEKLLKRHIVPAWGHRDVVSINRGDLVELLEQVRTPCKVTKTTKAGRPSRARRGGAGAALEVRRWARSLFEFAVELGVLVTNPFNGLRSRDRRRCRSRVLSMEELRAVWQCAQGLEYPFGAYFQLLILTGARRSEWANARREWLDPLVTRLEIPAQHYKSDRPQVTPLSALARSIVSKLPAHEDGSYLFSTTNGARPISGFSKAKARIDRFLQENGFEAEPWVVHDFRRTMATHMERLGIAPHVIEACLGHSLRGIAAVYRKYQYLPEKQAAFEVWANEVTGTQPLIAFVEQPHTGQAVLHS